MIRNFISRITVFAVLFALLMGTEIAFAEDSQAQSLSRDGYTLE